MAERMVTYQDMDLDRSARASQGPNMIEFTVILLTDHITEQPRQCWSSGKVTRMANGQHGILYGEHTINTIAEIGPAVEALAAEAQITIHASGKANAYAKDHDRVVLEEKVAAAIKGLNEDFSIASVG